MITLSLLMTQSEIRFRSDLTNPGVLVLLGRRADRQASIQNNSGPGQGLA
jgi:hypothetical protein